MPVVLVGRREHGVDACSASVDDVLGGRLVLEHLRDQGHRRVAFVGGPSTLPEVRDRYEGALQAAGDRVEVVPVATEGLQVAHGRDAAEQLLGTPPLSRATAAFCANDLLALGLLQRLLQQGVRVPQDIAVVGYDDIEFAAAAAVPLSSVHQPREQLGRAAAGLLLQETLAGDHEHRQLVFAPELRARSSSAHHRGV